MSDRHAKKVILSAMTFVWVFLTIGADAGAYVTPVISGTKHVVAVRSDGSLRAWGYNGLGQLGDGSAVDRLTPVRIGNDTDWVEVSAGGVNTVAMKSDGSLWTWGYNGHGEIGDGTTTARYTPVRVGGNAQWTSVSAGFQYTVAVRADGTLWAWRGNTSS